MMIDNEVSFTSLCYITVDYEGRIWLNRLADVEDDIRICHVRWALNQTSAQCSLLFCMQPISTMCQL